MSQKETLRPVVESFVFWPTNLLRPPASLQERLARRIEAETGENREPCGAGQSAMAGTAMGGSGARDFLQADGD